MNKRLILIAIIIFSILIPGLYILQLESVFNNGSSQEEMVRAIAEYCLRVWISWIIFVIVAIYAKWNSGNNNFFKIIYFLIVFVFGIEGIYIQRMVNIFEIATPFQDSYSYSGLATLLNIIMASALTAFLQAGVWWFTRKWHRQ